MNNSGEVAINHTVRVLNDHADRLEDEGLLPYDQIHIMIGNTVGDEVRKAYRRVGFARMWSEGLQMDPYPGEPWGLDNGAYGAAERGEGFPSDEFRRRLDHALEVADERDAPPYLAVVPDQVKGGLESLDFSLRWLPEVREKAPDWNWYLGLQDDFTFSRVEEVMDEFDGLLLGGGDLMKPHAREWADFAHERGLGFHFARCGTIGKLEYAFEVGADSLDSLFPVRDPNRWGRFLDHVAWLYEVHFGG